ncbi:MAG: L-rhamnose mutarotase [Bacteroidota bacterium]
MLSLLLFYSCNKRSEESAADNEAARYGSVIRVKPEKLEEYKVLHANPWPEVNRILRENNIRNYSIYYRDGLLFSYFEYVGHDYDADMRKIAEDSITQSWWKLTDPCQEPIESAGEGVWWAEMEEVYHLE